MDSCRRRVGGRCCFFFCNSHCFCDTTSPSVAFTSKVFLGRYRLSGELRAVKVVPYTKHHLGSDSTASRPSQNSASLAASPPQRKQLDPVERERQVLSFSVKWPHPNIVQCYGWFFSGQFICFVLEYLDGGSLETLIREYGTLMRSQGQPDNLPEHVIACLAVQVPILSPLPTPPSFLQYGALCSVFPSPQVLTTMTCHSRFLSHCTMQALRGLQHIHNAHTPIIHRDIKPDNILIGTNGQVKLSDFNSARVNTQKSEAAMTYVGTAMFMSVRSARCICFVMRYLRAPTVNLLLRTISIS